MTRTTCVIDIGTIAKILGIDDINFKDYRLVPFHRCRNPGKRSEIQRRDETGICTIHEGVQICRFRTCSAKRSVRPGIKPKASGKRVFPFPMSKILYNRKKKNTGIKTIY